MSDDFVLNVRQIGQYPRKSAAAANDALLIQNGGIGGNAGDYSSMTPADLVASALDLGGTLRLAPGSGIAWNGALLSFAGNLFSFNAPLSVPSLNATEAITLAGKPVATQAFVQQLIGGLAAQPNVRSFDGRTGDVLLSLHDILSAGGAQIDSPFFIGNVRAPTVWNSRQSDEAVATTAFVWSVVNDLLCNQMLVFSFNGRGGDVVLTTDDVNAAFYATGGTVPRAPHPAPFDYSNRIATTGWTADEIGVAVDAAIAAIGDPSQHVIDYVNANFAPLVSPQLSGTPSAPTAAPGSTTGQIATTAFVMNAVSSATAGVSSFNTRTGAVTLITADITAAGGAPIASPALTGNPTAPTPATLDSDTSIATTAFVHAVVGGLAAGVSSFNARTGAVTLTTADITGAGGAPTASPALTGTPTAPTASGGTNTTQLATTAFVQAALSGVTAGVSSWNGRVGAVNLQANDVSAAGGAMVASPTFTGIPLAPTAAPGTNTQQIATTAFVMAAVGGGGVVSSFNGRTGAVTLTTADVTGVGGAPITSPAFTGTPTGPTALQTVNDTTLATTAYVRTAIASATGVSSFNTRTGAVTLNSADITAASGALLASPIFTGTPAGPTAAPGANNTQLATTAFVTGAVGASVTAFNTRTGAITLIAGDITSAGGALLASPTFTGTPNSTTPTTGTNNTQIATTAFVQASIAAAGGVVYKQADTAPAFTNTFWFDSIKGQLYVCYTDPGTSAQNWVIANSPLTAPPAAPTTQVFLSGSGTYTKPTAARYITVEMIGGGGGGSGGTAGTNGTATTFGGLTANAGSTGSITGTASVANGGTATGGDLNLTGGDGANGTVQGAGQGGGSGSGGASYFGGSGRTVQGGYPSGNSYPNTGAGGPGGATTSSATSAAGQGGGAGGYLRKLIASPNATYTYSVGPGGVGSVAAGNHAAAGNGGSGVIIVMEFY